MEDMSAPAPTIESAIQAALAGVQDPEIRRPITELGMVKSIDVAADAPPTIGILLPLAGGPPRIGILLTVAGCPLRDKLPSDITAAVSTVAGVSRVAVDFGVMSPE